MTRDASDHRVLRAVAVLLALTIGGVGLAGRAEAATPSANQLMFSYSLSQFLAVKAQHPAPFDWSDDGCSASIFSPIVNAYFLDQCKRHDFGYRNWRLITGQANVRLAIDNRFHTDMNDRCSHYSVFNPLRPICYGVAEDAYLAVRAFGRLT